MRYHKVKSVDEYDYPSVYDSEYGTFEPDGPFFHNLISKPDIALLDLACGTGRLTIPLSSMVKTTFAIDASDRMLSLAKIKDAGTRVAWLHGDYRKFELETKFDLIIMGGNSFQALLTDQDIILLLHSVKKHLNYKGKFAFNCRLLNDDIMVDVTDFRFWHEFVDAKGHTVEVLGRHKFDHQNSVATYQTLRLWPDYSTISEVSLRYLPCQKITSLLHSCNLRITEIYDTPEKTGIKPTSGMAYVVCARN